MPVHVCLWREREYLQHIFGGSSFLLKSQISEFRQLTLGLTQAFQNHKAGSFSNWKANAQQVATGLAQPGLAQPKDQIEMFVIILPAYQSAGEKLWVIIPTDKL